VQFNELTTQKSCISLNERKGTRCLAKAMQPE
jgi:hypothetical protein